MIRSNNRRALTMKSDGKLRNSRMRKNKRPVFRSAARNLPPSRFSNYSNFAWQAWKDINIIRKFINTEVHYSDVNIGSGGVSSTPTFTLANGTQTGDDVTNRTGRSVKFENVDLRFILTNNATAVNTFTRVMIIQDTQPNAAIFAIGDLITATTVVAPYNTNNQYRFVIVFDEVYCLSTAGPSNISQVIRRAINFHTEYNSNNAGTVADITTNSLYLVVFSDQATNTPTFQGNIRAWFVDN